MHWKGQSEIYRTTENHMVRCESMVPRLIRRSPSSRFAEASAAHHIMSEPKRIAAVVTTYFKNSHGA
jgi:hypothetical protein